MIAYRSETAMVGLLKKTGIDFAAARRLLQDLFVSEADILPNTDDNILLVRVHPASRPAANSALKKLFDQLNDTELNYPETDLKLVYELGGQNTKL